MTGNAESSFLKWRRSGLSCNVRLNSQPYSSLCLGEVSACALLRGYSSARCFVMYLEPCVCCPAKEGETFSIGCQMRTVAPRNHATKAPRSCGLRIDSEDALAEQIAGKSAARRFSMPRRSLHQALDVWLVETRRQHSLPPRISPASPSVPGGSTASSSKNPGRVKVFGGASRHNNT